MNILAEILSSRVRAEIFRLLFSGTVDELHVREIQRRSGFNDRSIRQELGKLERRELVKKRKSSNRLYYRANVEHPLYQEIHNLVLKTSGLVDVLREVLNDKRIKVAFVFGSIAQGREKAGSDVDLMVIGSLGMRELSAMLSGVTDKIGREVNPHIFDEKEFRRRVKDKEHFVTRVLESTKMFIVGDENDLSSVGR